MTLNERETATVLAALRFWRKTSGAPYMMGSFTPEDVVKYRTGIMPDYFEDESPLTDEEIDALCEKINSDPPAANRYEQIEGALYIALPFVEDAETDPAYKNGAVAKVLRTIRAALEEREVTA